MMRKSVVAFACGKRESGKSYLLRRYAERFPRRIVLDTVAEYFGELPGAYECSTLSQTLDALEAAARVPRWTVVTCIDPRDAARLFRALAPEGSLTGGYSRAVGGVVVECGEVDTIFPNNAGIKPECRNLIQRGRHYRVSFLGATQRPRDVHRVVTSQSDVVCVFRQHESRDLQYVATNIGAAAVPIVRGLEEWSHLRYMPNRGSCEVIDKDGRTLRTVDLFDGKVSEQLDLSQSTTEETENGRDSEDA